MNKNIRNRIHHGVEARLIALLLVALMFSCTKPPESDVYKIAVAAPQIGPYKALGLSIINGAELAVERKNANGGINGKKVELVKVDDGGLAGEGTWRARSLVEQGVLGVIGHLNSDISIPASEIYSKAKIPQISPGSTSPFFTDRKKVNGFVFRTIGRDDEQGELAAKFALEKGFKKLAVIYNNRGYGSSLASEFLRQIDNAKTTSQIVFYKSYKVGECDFCKETSELKTKLPDFIFFAGEYGDAAKFVNKLRESGLKTTFLGSEGVFDEEFIEGAKNNAEDALVISLPEITDQTFLESYKSKFGKDLGSYSANSFDATNILMKAIENVGSKDTEKIAKAISETKDYEGLTGKLSFNEKGDLTEPNFIVYKIAKGKFEVAK